MGFVPFFSFLISHFYEETVLYCHKVFKIRKYLDSVETEWKKGGREVWNTDGTWTIFFFFLRNTQVLYVNDNLGSFVI